MKEDETANTLGNGEESATTSKYTKYAAYGLIGLLLVFIFWVNTTDTGFDYDVERVASVTSWSVGTSSETFGYLRSDPRSDLSVEILRVGVLDASQKFLPNDTLTEESVGAVRIRVSNEGRLATGPWRLQAVLPTRTPYTFVSDEQNPLERNESKTFVLSFDTLEANDEAEIVAEVFPLEAEQNTTNNVVSRSIQIF